jgi:glyoxylase-like metal-dependent hydrolase (beta-lactamase superfamily II)
MLTTIELDNPFLEGANSSYLFADGDDTVLIDTGVSTPETLSSLTAQLSSADVTLDDIDDILLTHWHADHAGLAGDIQSKTGATVWAHEADTSLSAQHEPTWQSMSETYQEAFEDWGLTSTERDEALFWIDRRDEYWSQSADIEPFEDGKTFQVGESELQALHTPGHSLGSVCYLFETDSGREGFSGDTLLPAYTPNIGGGEFREPNTLLTRYINTLGQLIDKNLSCMYPGHRGKITDPSDRARSIIQHHRERLITLVEIIENQEPVNVREITSELFDTVEELHLFIGCAETDVHIEYLKQSDLLWETKTGYELSADAKAKTEAKFESRL